MQEKEYILWYQTPSQGWLEGLPLGNGRLAAMAVEEQEDSHFVLNHERLWRGLTKDRSTKDVAKWLPEVRKLLDEEDYFHATALANLFFGGGGGISGTPGLVDAYQPAGELHFSLPGYTLKTRSLHLNTGVAESVREMGSARVTTKAVIDCTGPAGGNLLWQAEGTEPFSANLCLSRIEDPQADVEVTAQAGTLTLKGSFHGGISYRVEAKVETNGTVVAENGTLQITNADYIRVILDIAIQEEPLDTSCDFAACFAAHLKQFPVYMNRFSLSFSEIGEDIPTDQRIQRLKDGEDDPYLQELYIHFGRYLLISSSVCGKLPANLQGKWNEELNPPWDCDYHFDINLEMNYWMAEPCGMPECVNALISLAEHFMESAKEAAKNLYGCRGIWFPIQSDAWGRSTPESYGWAVWIGAAGWIGWHFWQHYLYSGDKAFLKEHAMPYFEQVALFYEDYMQEDAQGLYKIYPSQSPENRFAGTGNFPVSLGVSSAMDVQIAYDSLTYAASAARILGDEEKADRWLQMREKLPPFKIGSDGRLLEWEKEREEVEPGHRHLSHLYGLYPSDLFTQPQWAPQKEAAIRSLHSRLSQGGGHTGWSRAWVACLMARIGEKEGFYEHFSALIRSFATASLLDLHPPRIFQIEGNLGAVAAAVEAVASVQNGTVHLLQGLPKEWNNGQISGLCLPGGHKLSLSWKNGELTTLTATMGFTPELLIEGFPPIVGKPGTELCVI